MSIGGGFDVFLSSFPFGQIADSNDDFGGVQTDEMMNSSFPSPVFDPTTFL
jgi:hypothetical protein